MRIVLGILIFIGLVAIAFATLIFAHAGSAKAECFRSYDWTALSCLLREHAELGGALLGSAGTIFAGWLAYMGVQQQIGAQLQANILTEEATLRRESDRLADELYGLVAAGQILLPFANTLEIDTSTTRLEGLTLLLEIAKKNNQKIGVDHPDFEIAREYSPLEISVELWKILSALNLVEVDAAGYTAKRRANQLTPKDLERYETKEMLLRGAIGMMTRLRTQIEQSHEDISSRRKKIDEAIQSLQSKAIRIIGK